MKKFLWGILVFALGMFFALPLYADSGVQSTKHTKIELFQNGKDTVLAKFTIKPDWHIYWSNPGEIGLPTTVSADNSNLSIINQSVPQVRSVYDTLDEYLYENTAYFELKLDNLRQAEISFDFVECNDVCKPQKLIFNMVDVPAVDDELWREIKTAATKTFPQKIKLTSPLEHNEVHLDKIYNEVKFVPTEQDVIDEQSIDVSKNAKDTIIKWSSEQNGQLKNALIIGDGKAYIADIVYSQNSWVLLYIILLAFCGGIILNAMPCVFPILSLKIFTLLKQRKMPKRRARLNAFLYVCGVLSCFMLLTVCLILFKNSGEAIGWGFQLQSAWFVGIMAVIFFVLFLYMTEVIHFSGFANHFIHRVAGFNDFTTGFFAVLIASPCTGPFMGAAIGYAFMRSNVEIFAVFTSLALGYALPYALIELNPHALNRILPKPGKWMHKVKIILSIPILLTAMWLSYVGYVQITDSYLTVDENDTTIQWNNFDIDKINGLNEAKENIFIDFTADWCLTCKFNEKIIINTKRFRNFAVHNKVHLFVADLTENNEMYHQALAAYGRDGIPLYVYYHQGKYRILPLFFSIDDLEK